MAQLDRFLNLLVTNNGTALLMSEGEVATLTIKDSPRPVMKQPLTSAQILTLVREIAPQNQPHSLDAAGNVRFEYTSADGTFEISLNQNGKISARIERRPAAASAPKPNVTPAHAAVPQNGSPKSPSGASPRNEPPRAEAAPTPRAAATGNRALDRMESLLRLLVSNKASDLHLRAGSPPMLRASGEIAPIPNEPSLTSDDIEAMVQSVMLEHNRHEFKEINDSDFAHEITGVARFRGNALRDRKGTGAVFRAIPAAVVTVEQMGITA
ncbi:MAG TPA: hypothetical protein VK648_01835, partial [Gemmatimonadaceae bacterium]|nr:hypothetical protein [Gemmatimonadaceae bacterium]